MNKIVLIGRMTADAELRTTQNGKNVTSFNIAVDRQFKGPNGEKETDFFTIVLWGSSAEFAVNYLGKGQRVAVEGSMQIRKYVDKDGVNRIAPEVVGNSIEGLEKKEQGQGAAQQQYAPAPQYQPQQQARVQYQQPATNNRPPQYQQPAPVQQQYQQPAPAPAAVNIAGGDDWCAPPMPDGMSDPFEDQ
jgi:single-strand DNA-binding protein